MERMTLTEAQDIVEQSTGTPDSPLEAISILIEDSPPLIEALRHLRVAVDYLQKQFEKCECGSPQCIDNPTHFAISEDTIHPPALKVEAAIEELKFQTALFVQRIANCDCRGCKEQRRVNAAPFN